MARDEGRAQTRLIMAAVKARRDELGWSAEKLAEEMRKAGVPWKADIVVNLEHGRRASLRVHELIALAYVLAVQSPLDVLVPYKEPFFPVTPNTEVATGDVLGWFLKNTGPLADYLAASVDEQEEILRRRGEERAMRDAMAPEIEELLRKAIELRKSAAGR